MHLIDLLKELTTNGVFTTIQYDIEKNQLYLDLDTRAKSDLHLYEDGILRGRYNYEQQIDLTQDTDLLITQLCLEFKQAMCGRPYGQEGWFKLCEQKQIKINFLYV